MSGGRGGGGGRKGTLGAGGQGVELRFIVFRLWVFRWKGEGGRWNGERGTGNGRWDVCDVYDKGERFLVVFCYGLIDRLINRGNEQCGNNKGHISPRG